MKKLLHRLHGNAVIAAHLGQRRIPYLDRSRIEALRDRRVRGIVRYAARRVPFYQELFARQGTDPRAIRGAHDLRQLPLLDRDEVRREPDRFVAQGLRDTLALLTSGTTAIPLEVHHDRRSLLANIAFGEREREVIIAMTGAGFRPVELYIGYESSNFAKVLAYYEEHARLPVRPRRRSMSMTAPFRKIVATLDEVRPDILTAYGSFLDEFFRRLSLDGTQLKLPPVALYMGETLAADRRRDIEREFGISILSRYSAVEAFKIAYYCEARTGFHVHEDLCDLRLLREDGSEAAAGEPGEIVISNLVNRGSVLLNYPIGDLATRRTEPCPCGRTFQVLSEIEGRLEDYVTLANGEKLHPRTVWAAFKDDREIIQYRLTQQALRRFELELVTRDRETFERSAVRAQVELRALLGQDIELNSRFEPELGKLERERRGKFRAVESRLNRGRPSS